MSTDSSDNEDLELLKEAQDTQFLQDKLYKSDKDTLIIDDKPNLISLRSSKNDDDQFNFVKVTPEFRKFVAKRLCKILDDKLEKEINYDSEIVNKSSKRKKVGVKLFSDSEKYLKINDIVPECKSRVFEVKRRKDSPAVDFSVVTVTGEDILSQKDTKYWSNRSKAKIFCYKSNNNGQLELID